MKEQMNVLDELNKGACMGMDAIDFIIDKVNDEEFRKILKEQYNDYENISKKIHELYPDNEKEPHETNVMTKAMTWYGIEMKTMTDKSSSKIAELLMQGTNMGIIEGRKLLNNKDINKEVNAIIDEYVTMQENAVEKLKQFL